MISVIGAGPVGSYAAYLLAKHEDVSLFEEHREIGRPVQCTGIVTPSINKIIKNKFVVNRVGRVRVFSPNNSFVELKIKKNLVIDRARFDRFLAEKAVDAGARLFLKCRFKGFKDKRFRKTKIFIGADGAVSEVAKAAGLFKGRSFVQGIQVRIKTRVDADVVCFYLGIGDIAWVVPESGGIARIGLISRKNAKTHFNSFIKRFKGKTIEKQAGVVPVYNPTQITQKDNIYLVGDAATQVKASTYGGIIQGLLAAEELSYAITNNKKYEKLWHKRLGKDLWMHLKIRQVMDRFSKKDYNCFVSLFQRDDVKKILEEHDRDFPSRFLMELLLKQPRLLRYWWKLL